MNTMMKLAAALPAIALISACSTTKPVMPQTPASETVTDAAYDRMAPAPYTCTDDSQIMAKQSINKKQVMINATLPKVEWSEQPIILVGGVNGETASYVNESNPAAIYAWHMKGNQGIFAIKWADGKEYQVNCEMGR